MAIPIPNLPTDNLYKFMALSGLTIGVFCLTFMELEVSKTEKLVLETQAKVADVASYEVFIDSIISGTNSDITKQERLKLSKNLKDKLLAVRLGNSEAKATNKANRRRLAPMMITSIVAFLISLLGFRAWYYNVQKPLDRILQINLKKAETAISEAEKKP